MQTASGGPLFPWQKQDTELIDNWKYKLTPASRSRVLSGKGVETDKQYTERRKKETAKRTWRSDAADIAHGIGEGVLALHPYTAIPYFGAKVGQDFLNGTYGWHTALNASIPLFHMAPQAVGLKEATNVALEDAANAGSKTARNLRVAREINQATKNTKLNNNSTVIPHEDQFDFWHGGLESDFDFGNLDVFRKASKQSKRNRNYAGFYMYSTPRQQGAFNYGFGEAHGIKLKPEAKKLKVDFNTERMEAQELQNYRNQGYDYIEGKDIWGAPEYILLNKDAIQHTGFFDNSLGHNIHILRNRNIPKIDLSMNNLPSKTSLKFFERKPSRISEAERAGVPKGERNQPFKSKQPTEHVQGNEAVKMFKEYGGEPIPEGSINGEQLRKYVAEARERYGLVNNANITDEEIAQALYKHSKELGGNTAAVNAQGEPQLLFRGDTKAYTELRNNHHESGGTEDNILGTLFLDRTGIGEGWGPDRYLYLSNKNGQVMAPYRTGIESESFSLLKPKFKDGYLYDGFGKGYISDKQISYPYWSYTRKSGETIQGNKIASDNFADGTVNHLNAFVVRTPSVRDITNEVVVTGGKPGTPPPFNWLIPKESRIGHDLHDVRLAQNKVVVEEAKKHNQGLLKSDRGSYWRGEEHEDYDYFALPDFNVQGAKHLLPYDLRIPRNWKDKNIYRGLIPLTTGYTLYNIFNQPQQQLQYQKQGGKMNILEFLKNGSGIHIKKKNRGSFTRWCGGNVTEECIRRGKASSNPKIRKKAIFADNARHFKHQQGGTIVNGLMDIYRSIKQNQAIDASMDAMRQQVELDKQKLFYNEYKKQLGLQTDRSNIVNANKAYNEAKNVDYSDVNQQFLDKQQQLLNQKQQNDNSLISSIGGISGTILNSIGKKKNTSSSNNKIFTTDSFWTNPTLKNSQVNSNFWTNPTIANAL